MRECLISCVPWFQLMEGMQQKVTELTNRNKELMITGDHQTAQITTLQEHLKVRLDAVISGNTKKKVVSCRPGEVK